MFVLHSSQLLLLLGAENTRENWMLILVIIAGRPDPVVNCSISNQSQSSFLLSCSPGFNGGLAQAFGLEVLDAETSRSILNMTSQLPKFQVVGLLSEKSFTLTVHSSNLRGQSEKVILRAHTTKPPETVDILKSEKAKIGSLKTRLIISPVLGVLIGVGGAIVLVSITLFAIMCFRVKYEKLSQSLGRRKRSSASTSGNSDKEFQDDLYVDLTDNSPDLIPSDGKIKNGVYLKSLLLFKERSIILIKPDNKQNLIFVLFRVPQWRRRK